MPASLRLSETDILVTVRDREGPRRWIATYLSTDNGATWDYINDAVSDTGVGNPPAMIRLRDGRICLLYGYRAEPYSIRAVLSGDGGRTWSDPSRSATTAPAATSATSGRCRDRTARWSRCTTSPTRSLAPSVISERRSGARRRNSLRPSTVIGH